MCGIAGIISLNQSQVDIHQVKKMTDTLAHRGPDGEGQWTNDDQVVALGHRRLSIIDLTDHGAQPMHYLQRYTITFNGEIYNYIEIKQKLIKAGYQFRSESDTEVLLALYDQKGEDCLEDLDGMFAFAIWDEKEQNLFCARDRFGEKPFFYCFLNGQLFFASEIKALWSIGLERSLDWETFFYYMHLGRLHHPFNRGGTFFEHITRLKPGHYFNILTESEHTKNVQEKCYWSLPKVHSVNKADLNQSQIIEEYYNIFERSVKRRLRSDVPVGSSLSGGLDSSSVVCMINELNKDRNLSQSTFSARFPGFAKDEGYYMDLVLNQVNAKSYFTYPNESGFVENFNDLCYYQDEPFGSSSIYAQYEVMRLAKRKNIIVLLDGQGADEMLAGYSFYMRSFEASQKLSEKTQKDIETELNWRSMIKSFLPSIYSKYSKHKVEKYLRNKYKEEGYHDEFIERIVGLEYPDGEFSSLYEHLRSDLLEGNLEDLLRYSDRNSMAHSREVRLPYLSHELVEFVMSLPNEYKIRDAWSKWIQRVSMEPILPKEITWRKDKIGYEPPQKKWMENSDFKDLLFESKETLFKNKIIDEKSLQSPIQSVEANQVDSKSWSHLMVAKLF